MFTSKFNLKLKARSVFAALSLCCVIALTGCAQHSSTYGIPPKTWNQMTQSQKNQIIAMHQAKKAESSANAYGSVGFAID